MIDLAEAGAAVFVLRPVAVVLDSECADVAPALLNVRDGVVVLVVQDIAGVVTHFDALVAHLESHAPWGARVEVQRTKEAPPFVCRTDGPGFAAARAALEEAFGRPAGEAGCGGSIPLLRTLQQAAPTAEFVLWGPEDVALSRIHASDESVDPDEIERMIVAQALLLERLAARARVA